MKRILFSLIFFKAMFSYGQTNEVYLQGGTSLLSFKGASATSTSFFNYSEVLNRRYTNNPYGSKVDFGYHLFGSFQRVTKSNLLFGLAAGYEKGRSKVVVSMLSSPYLSIAPLPPVTGKTNLNIDFLNTRPFVGYAFKFGHARVDVSSGFDIAWCLKVKEKGEVKTEVGDIITTSLDRKTIKTDFRPTMQVAAYYKVYGIYVGYAFGASNYKSGYIGGINECYSRIFRAGIAYRLYAGH
jgi:hypothetical protein